jgi:hypothetical protein
MILNVDDDTKGGLQNLLQKEGRKGAKLRTQNILNQS